MSACHDSFAQLCRSFGMSRKTGYKWLARYEAQGPRGLDEASHAPRAIPHRAADGVRDVFGRRALIQQCQVHKMRNVAEHLPKAMQRNPSASGVLP